MGILDERLGKYPFHLLWFLLLIGLVVAGSATLALPVGAEGVVRFYFFYDPNCEICHVTREQFVAPLLEEYGAQVEVTELSIAESKNMELLIQLEEELGATSGEIPEIVIGDDILEGYFEIEDSLRERVEYYLSEGGVDLPTPDGEQSVEIPADFTDCDVCDDLHEAYRSDSGGERQSEAQAADAAPIHAVFFYQPGCDECERSEHDLAYIQEKYPQVRIERVNVQEQPAFNQYLCEETGVPESKHLTAPSLFIGDEYLLDREVRVGAIEDIIGELAETGAPAWWVGWEAKREQVEKSIISRFESFGLLTVVGAGLIDGVNPCAFATMIFLISYLSINDRKGRQLLFTGAAFTLGVFLTYLGVGFGFFRALASLPFLNVIGKWVYGLTAALCLALAWGSLRDYRKARENRLEDMSLKLPASLQNLSKKIIRRGTSARRFVLSTFLIGIGVSLVELACTGQVYLPTIIYVLGVPALKARATLSLLLYNVMFILPLIGVFILVYFGTSSKQLVDLLNRHAATVKIIMAALFVALASWLIYSILAL